jgi:transposase
MSNSLLQSLDGFEMYCFDLEALVRPLAVTRSDVIAEVIVIQCRNSDVKTALSCSLCGKMYQQYDQGRLRRIRHLDFQRHEVFVDLSIPRVNCPKHGIRQILQSLADNKGKLSIPMQHWILTQLSDEESAAEFSKRIGVTRTLIGRCMRRVAVRCKNIKHQTSNINL